ncbi:hypothetical protein AC1031_020492 [Aphanomyces cochlioides]|nr:hypothetical protein AC1031_020492 [Aphanomyces cochlioides]
MVQRRLEANSAVKLRSGNHEISCIFELTGNVKKQFRTDKLDLTIKDYLAFAHTLRCTAPAVKPTTLAQPLPTHLTQSNATRKPATRPNGLVHRRVYHEDED